MTRADNTHHLVRAAAERHHLAVTRAHAAIETLDHAGAVLNFTTVAQTAGVSRGWLYNQPELRDAIIRLRSPRSPAAPAVPASERTTAASLRQRLDDVRDEIARLRADNAVLREQLARRLGEERAQTLRR